jgi:hypothetical protein
MAAAAGRQLTPERRAEYVRAFEQHGFCVVRGLFGPEEVARISAAFDDLLGGVPALIAPQRSHLGLQLRQTATTTHPSAQVVSKSGARYTLALHSGGDQGGDHDDALTVRHVTDCGSDSTVLAHLGRDPRLLTVASDVLGLPASSSPAAMVQLINQAHYKEPGGGIAFAWHQDSINRGVDKGRFLAVHGNRSYCNISVAVDAETPDNGPLGVYAGSHMQGHFVPGENSSHLQQGHFSWEL